MFPAKRIWTIFTILVFTVPPCFATEQEGFTAKNVCPFECCTYGDWLVVEDTAVHEHPDIDSQILGALVQGDTVAVTTGEVHVVPGIARIIGRPHWSAESLDSEQKVEILQYIGEGYSAVRQGNTIHRVKIARTKQECLENPKPSYCWVEVLEEPESHWWVQLGSAFQGGWVSMQSPGLKATDACS